MQIQILPPRKVSIGWHSVLDGDICSFSILTGRNPRIISLIGAVIGVDSWTRSKQDVQQLVSDVCGDWCLYWCIAFSRATSENRLSNFMEKFSDQDKELNDRHVFRIIHSRFPRILNSTKHFINLDSLIREKLKIFAHPECLLNRQTCRNRHG